MSIALFHQNEVDGVQGGIERFISSILEQAKGTIFLVTENAGKKGRNRLCLNFPFPGKIPQWINYIIAVFLNLSSVRAFLRENNVEALEFSRPEYAVFAFFLSGRKTFTFHGTGPLPKEPFKWIIHFSCCWLLPFCADTIQIVGRRPNGLPRPVRMVMREKIKYVEAWYDDCFSAAPFRQAEGKMRIFYAGRLATAKNPKLLFAVIREIIQRYPGGFSFVYCGADSASIPDDLKGSIQDLGLLSAAELAKAMAGCHFGILTSHTEGSPFVVVEALACGRAFLLPPIGGLLDAFPDQPGVFFAKTYSVEEYVEQILAIAARIRDGKLSAQDIANGVSARSKKNSVCRIAENILGKPQTLPCDTQSA